MDEVFLKIPSDIFFLLLNLEIDLIFQHQRQNEEKEINVLQNRFNKIKINAAVWFAIFLAPVSFKHDNIWFLS